MKKECKPFCSDASTKKIKDRIEKEENRIGKNLANKWFIKYFIANN